MNEKKGTAVSIACGSRRCTVPMQQRSEEKGILTVKTKRSAQRADFFTLILITLAAMIAVTGIAALLPDKTAVPAQGNSVEDTTIEYLEVFAPNEGTIMTAAFTGFSAPVSGIITSNYGYRSDPFTSETTLHRGVDIAVREGTEVKAVYRGTVVESAYNSVGGNYIILDHGNGTQSYYGHLRTRIVSRGDTVAQGDVIGLSGKTGMVTGPHLHFQLSYNDRSVDPLNYIEINNDKN
jgi:murein DD-endopeptidase MepM/ murein hydrolase activator NlpD